MAAVDRAVTIEDLRQLALRRLPCFISQYVEQAAGDGGGVSRNIAAFRKYQLIPRGLVEVTPVDTTAELFGKNYSSLFGISAVGTGGIYRRHFDEILAEVAREANLPYILSGSATASIETSAGSRRTTPGFSFTARRPTPDRPHDRPREGLPASRFWC